MFSHHQRRYVVAVALAVVLIATAVPAEAQVTAGGAPYYLALGDSLSQGVQPNSAGQSVETEQGYANDLWSQLHATKPDLKLAKLGCPGETTTTMINGGICPYPMTSQLAEATAFLTTHRVTLVTIDIGANNIDACVSGAGIDQTCLAAGEATAGRELPVILQALRQAAPAVPIVAMNYYDPFVAAALKGGKFVGLAVESKSIASAYNRQLTAAYESFGIPVVNVAGAFAPINLPGLPYVGLPVNLALICALSWMCAPSPVGPNIHATPAGYSVIADLFAARAG